jgi:hypothetical protein
MMKWQYSQRSRKSYRAAPPAAQKAVGKQVKLLVGNLHHPSLHAKKYDESRDFWQGRVNRDWRFYFTIINDTYHIEDVIPHPM